MLFNSIPFVIFFLIAVLSYYITPQRFRWIQLLAASCFFYVYSSAWYILLLFVSIGTTYLAGRFIGTVSNPKAKRTALVCSIVLNLLLLVFFKYFGLLSYGAKSVLDLFNVASKPKFLDFSPVVPIGISFYTFKVIGYMIDVYRGKIAPEKHFGKYAAFAAFFPEIMSGPIDRADSLLPQLNEVHKFDYNTVTAGLKLMALGYFKKAVVADTLCTYVDTVYGNLNAQNGFSLLIAAFLFSIQIYCDFSGYSDIARGAGRVMGFRMIENFDNPYFATSIKDFWRRWHISLSTWFRDYLYIPLGGNRCGKLRNYTNLMITFLVSGLWHGANITFIVWGALHGIYQVIGKLTLNLRKRIYSALRIDRIPFIKKAASILITFVLVTLAWIFFRADTISDATYFLTHLFDWNMASKYDLFVSLKSVFGTRAEFYRTACVLPVFFMFTLLDYFKGCNTLISRQKAPVRYIIYVLIILYISLFARAGVQDFIYLQF